MDCGLWLVHLFVCNYLDKDFKSYKIWCICRSYPWQLERCSRNHFNSHKYKAVHSFSLHFLQNSPLVQLHSSASDCKDFGKTSLQAILWIPFQLFRRILNCVSSITNVPSLQC